MFRVHSSSSLITRRGGIRSFVDCSRASSVAAGTSFAPIATSMLKRYSFFKYLGFFGVQQQTAIGARQFLRTMRAILASVSSVVWITPQGRFMDVRDRSFRLQSGLGALAAPSGNTTFLPLAIEYHVLERTATGDSDVVWRANHSRTTQALGSAEEWTKRFSDALEETQDELAARSCRRDPSEWVVLDRGKSGVNLIYDSWLWLRARISGQKFVREHRTRRCNDGVDRRRQLSARNCSGHVVRAQSFALRAAAKS